MATVSSHILDAVQGLSAAGIRVVLERTINIQSTSNTVQKQTVFDVVANEEGRISETVSIDTNDTASSYELVFYAAEYFKTQNLKPEGRQIIEQAVVRLTLPDPDERYHIPMILSPHSYSLWWSQ